MPVIVPREDWEESFSPRELAAESFMRKEPVKQEMEVCPVIFACEK